MKKLCNLTINDAADGTCCDTRLVLGVIASAPICAATASAVLLDKQIEGVTAESADQVAKLLYNMDLTLSLS